MKTMDVIKRIIINAKMMYVLAWIFFAMDRTTVGIILMRCHATLTNARILTPVLTFASTRKLGINAFATVDTKSKKAIHRCVKILMNVRRSVHAHKFASILRAPTNVYVIEGISLWKRESGVRRMDQKQFACYFRVVIM